MRLWLIKDGKQYLLDGAVKELPDGIRDGYIRRAAESARRKEWKTTGEGAKFTGTYEPGCDAESRAPVNAFVAGFSEYNGAVYFSERIDGVSGIYKKISADDHSEAIAVSSNDRIYGAPDIFRHRLAVPVTQAGEAHIAVSDLPSFDLHIVTEGNTVESDPVWSRSEPDVLYFSSAGLPEGTPGERQEEASAIMTPASLMNAMNRPSSASRGPASLCRLDLRSGEFTTIFEDTGFDFVKPYAADDRSLYYIKRPYSQNAPRGGCLTDILMFPVRLVKSLFGFLSFFSLKYSGTPLSSGGTKAKQKDESQLFIDGNLINAEKELKANRNEKAPGIIPKSWELRKLSKDGRDELIRGGVLCYTIDENGKVVYSNGKFILRIDDSGEEKLAAGDGVSYMKYFDIQ